MLALLLCPSSLGLVAAPHWQRFLSLHAGEWRGRWSTLGPDGNVLDEVTAAQRLEVPAGQDDVAINTLIFVTGSIKSDCSTCFDSEETKEVPAGAFTPEQLPYCVAGAGSALGPRVLRSGAMSFEACLRHGEQRVRMTAQFAPQSITASTVDGTPMSLTLGRVTIAREALPPAAVSAVEAAAVDSDWAGDWTGPRHAFSEEPPSPTAEAGVAVVRCSGAELEPAAGECQTLLRLGPRCAAILPSRIQPAQPTPLQLVWRPPGTEKALLLRASIEALGRRVVSTESTTVMSPPRLLELEVSELRRGS